MLLRRLILGCLLVSALFATGLAPAQAAGPDPAAAADQSRVQVALALSGTAAPALAYARQQGLRVDQVTAHTVVLSGPAQQAAAAFGTRVRAVPARWNRRGPARYLAAATAPTVPAALRGTVRDVVGLDTRPLYRHSVIPTGYAGSDLATAYASTGLTGGGAGITIATVQFDGWNPGDATTYAAAAGIPLAADQITTIPVAGATGVPDNSGGDVEAALDSQGLLATAPKAKQRVYVAPNSSSGSLAVYDRIASDVAAGLVQVVSVSWGSCEADTGGHALTLADPINRIVANGGTVFAASGDSGAYDCAVRGSPDGRLSVDFPAALPSVVGVGGTSLTRSGGGYAETAWGVAPTTTAATTFPGSGSGGGTSNVFGRPAYQSSLGVSGSGRLVPDVSSLADATYGFGGYAQSLAKNGASGWVKFGGTSLGAPVWAGQLASALSTAGRTSGIGDIHAALYANPSAFRDVTSGANGYYSAGAGYDQVTGLGSPQWSALSTALGLDAAAPTTSGGSAGGSTGGASGGGSAGGTVGTPVPAGGTISSQAGQPVVATVTSPAAGTVAFTPLQAPSAPARMAAASQGLRIDAPQGGLTVSFALTPASLPAGALPTDVHVVHDGAVVPSCSTGAQPCVAASTRTVDALTYSVSAAGSGDWTFAADRVARLAGADRIATAVAVSQGAFADGAAQAAVLARADGYADALAGAPLAAAKGGPLLLTGSTGLAAGAATELTRALAPGATVYLLGGDSALSSAVADQVAALGFTVVRVAGSDRYATAAAIASAVDPTGPILLTTGLGFADALAAGAAAAHVHGAVLLTAGDRPAAATAAFLATHPGAKLYAVGGPSARAYPNATAVVGADRYATAVTAARTFFPGAAAAGLASGTSFPDALAAGPVLGASGTPLLLTGATLAPAASAYLRGTVPATVHLFGGLAALPAAVPGALWPLLG
ncbi:MAG: putative cell wall binding repeat 2-containing protein [Frankiales bacterium]|nr:putative cell wall binding repeat 2-containing protein [Frankiales bacterium]